MSVTYEPLAPALVPPGGAVRIERLDVLLRPLATPAEAAVQLRRSAAGCGLGDPAAWLLEQTPAAGLAADAAAPAAALGGAIRPVGTVVRRGGRAQAWTGPAFVPREHLLAGVADGHDAVVIRLAAGGEVLLAARPPWRLDIGAALAAIAPPRSGRDHHDSGLSDASAVGAPPTSWVVRVTFPHALPPLSFAARLLTDAGLPVDRVVASADGPAVSTYWARLGVLPRTTVDRVGRHLRHRHRLDLEPFVALGASGPDIAPGEP